MALDCEQMEKLVCGPKQAETLRLVKEVHRIVTVSNGTPSLLERQSTVERAVAKLQKRARLSPQKTVRKFSLTRKGLQTEGFDGMDILRVFAGIGVLLLVVDRAIPLVIKLIGFFT